MDVWRRDLLVEKRLLLDACHIHQIGPEVAVALHRYAASRAHDTPVLLAGRSLLTEAAEEIADLSSYLRWEAVRALGEGREGWADVIGRVLGDTLLTWSSLEQAARLAADMGIPNTGFPVQAHGETRRHPAGTVD